MQQVIGVLVFVVLHMSGEMPGWIATIREDVTGRAAFGPANPSRAVSMFDASRRDPSDPTADTPVVENPPPVSIEVFGRDAETVEHANLARPHVAPPLTTRPSNRSVPRLRC